MTPAEKILQKRLSTLGLSTDEWDRVSTAIKDRAFFSSRVKSADFLKTCQTRIAELLANSTNAEGVITSRAQVVSDIMEAAAVAGINTGTASLSNPGSEARANVIIDTNAGLASGYCQAEISNTYGARLAFPAQELIRIEERVIPRDWRSRWIAAGGQLYQGRMVALKSDPVWTNISRFGCPYPPFDFNSGMGVEDVSFDEAVQLGLIDDEYEPEKKSPLKAFNDGLEASLTLDSSDDLIIHKLTAELGDKVTLDFDSQKAVFNED